MLISRLSQGWVLAGWAVASARCSQAGGKAGQTFGSDTSEPFSNGGEMWGPCLLPLISEELPRDLTPGALRMLVQCMTLSAADPGGPTFHTLKEQFLIIHPRI